MWLRAPVKAYSYRDDPRVAAFADDRPVLIFDGKCVLCSRFAQFILRRDKSGLFRLLAAQTPLGIALYTHYRLDPIEYETNILIENGVAYFESEAAIRIFERLGPPWSLLAFARIFPAGWRDRFYRLIARNRLRWFGSRESCFVPASGQQDRFLS